MYCNYTKQGNKYIINKIYEKPLLEELKISSMKNYKDIPNCKVSVLKWDNTGIYYIIKDNNIYIGSTMTGFRKRFLAHYNGYNNKIEYTYEMLQNGADFYILYDMTGIEDEILTRRIEQEYINYFKNYTDYNVLNVNDTTKSTTKKNKIKYKTLKLKLIESEYEQAIQLLRDNGLLKTK